MKFQRDLMAAVRSFWQAVDHHAGQFKPVRIALGGTWVKLNNRWVQVDVLRICQDGSRIFNMQVEGAYVSFHETFQGVSAVEVY